MSGANFTFWEKDWYGDAELMECSAASQMVWFDMLVRIMRKCEPAGHLLINGRAPSIADLAAKLKRPEAVVAGALEELAAHNVFSRTEEGVIVCRKMAKAARRRRPDDAQADLLRATQSLIEPAVKEQSKRDKDADRARRYRERKRAAPETTVTLASRSSVTRHVTERDAERAAPPEKTYENNARHAQRDGAAPFLSFPLKESCPEASSPRPHRPPSPSIGGGRSRSRRTGKPASTSDPPGSIEDQRARLDAFLADQRKRMGLDDEAAA